MPKEQRLIIGRTDRIDFPSLDLFDISCKIDTGADTSSIHCHHVKLIEREGRDFLRFKLLNPEHILYNDRQFEVTSFSETIVKNSSGISETRYVIHSNVLIFGQELSVDLTLADRERMKYPVLIGRKFLSANRVLVDVTRVRLSHKKKCKLLLQFPHGVTHEDSDTFTRKKQLLDHSPVASSAGA